MDDIDPAEDKQFDPFKEELPAADRADSKRDPSASAGVKITSMDEEEKPTVQLSPEQIAKLREELESDFALWTTDKQGDAHSLWQKCACRSSRRVLTLFLAASGSNW